MAIGTPLGLTLNPDGTADWGGNERTILQALIDSVEAQVTVDGLNVNGDLTLHGHALTNASYVGLTAAGSSAVSRSYWFDSAGEAWVTDGNGNAVQVTSGGSLNVGGSSGGFYGDYVTSAGTARATYTTANATFDFRSAPSVAALVEHGDLRLRQGSVSNAFIVKCPANLAADTAVTLPGALPAGTRLLQVDATGTMTFSNVVTQDVTLSGSLRMSGSFLFAAKPVLHSACNAFAGGGAANSGDGTISLTAINHYAHQPITGLEPGMRITRVDFFVGRNSTSIIGCALEFRPVAGTFSVPVVQRPMTTGSGVFVNTLVAGASFLTGTLPHTVAASGTYYLQVLETLAPGATDVYYGATVYVDKVAGA